MGIIPQHGCLTEESRNCRGGVANAGVISCLRIFDKQGPRDTVERIKSFRGSKSRNVDVFSLGFFEPQVVSCLSYLL